MGQAPPGTGARPRAMGGAAGAASRLEATTDGGGRAFEPGMSPSESGGGRGAPETRGPAADRTRWMAHDGRRREAGVKFTPACCHCDGPSRRLIHLARLWEPCQPNRAICS